MKPLPKEQALSSVKEKSGRKGTPAGRYDGSVAPPVFPGLLNVEGGKGSVLSLEGKWASKRGTLAGRSWREGAFTTQTWSEPHVGNNDLRQFPRSRSCPVYEKWGRPKLTASR